MRRFRSGGRHGVYIEGSTRYITNLGILGHKLRRQSELCTIAGLPSETFEHRTLWYSRVHLIDFSWARKVNEAQHPLHLSKHVTWPEEARELELEPILVDYDRFMLDQRFKPTAEQ
jgi:hypothetical protein